MRRAGIYDIPYKGNKSEQEGGWGNGKENAV